MRLHSSLQHETNNEINHTSRQLTFAPPSAILGPSFATVALRLSNRAVSSVTRRSAAATFNAAALLAAATAAPREGAPPPAPTRSAALNTADKSASPFHTPLAPP
jgi:hypothetical protein